MKNTTCEEFLRRPNNTCRVLKLYKQNKTNFGVPFDDPYLFKLENWSDQEIGGLLLVLSLLVLCGSLMIMTKILSSLLKGKIVYKSLYLHTSLKSEFVDI